MKIRSKIEQPLFETRYILLLIASVLQIFLVSFFPGDGLSWINGLTFSFFMLACINLISHSRKIVVAMIFFAFISILLAWIPAESEFGQQSFPYEKSIVILFVGVIIYHIIDQVFRSKKVTVNVIFGAINIYILIGLLSGECNLMIYHFDPGAFTGNIDFSGTSDLRYFGYVTLTTLGYGDIVPVSELARAVAVFFSLTGQIYLAVIIALIVGKYISHSDRKDMKKEEQ